MLIDPRCKMTYFAVQKTAVAKAVILDFQRSVHESATNTVQSATSFTDNVKPELESSMTSYVQDESDLRAAHDIQLSHVDSSENDNNQPDAVPKQLFTRLVCLFVCCFTAHQHHLGH